LKTRECADDTAMIPSRIREIREVCLAIISGNMVAYRDQCEAGFNDVAIEIATLWFVCRGIF
jgi:hypothetical protein